MKWIAHRGNLLGPVPKLENHPDQIDTAIHKGFDVEIDVWKIHNKLYLGHDEPVYSIDIDFLQRDVIWCHAKNLEALEFLLNNGIHCFYHESDKFTLTSKGYIWTYPKQTVTDASVIVVLDKEIPKVKCFGVCGDFVEVWKSTYSDLL